MASQVFSMIGPQGNSVNINAPDSTQSTLTVVGSGPIQLKDNIKAAVAINDGGSPSFSIAVTGLTSSSVAVVNFATQTNAAQIKTAACGTNVINIVATADPGACTVAYTAFIAAQ